MKKEKKITIAICTYNRAERLRQLITAVRRQECQIPCEILVVDNNSTDGTSFALQKLAKMEGAPLRFVKEERQGIVHARNRAIEEAMELALLGHRGKYKFKILKLVGAPGFEPGASASRTRRSTRLSHAPTEDWTLYRRALRISNAWRATALLTRRHDA